MLTSPTQSQTLSAQGASEGTGTAHLRMSVSHWYLSKTCLCLGPCLSPFLSIPAPPHTHQHANTHTTTHTYTLTGADTNTDAHATTHTHMRAHIRSLSPSPQEAAHSSFRQLIIRECPCKRAEQGESPSCDDASPPPGPMGTRCSCSTSFSGTRAQRGLTEEGRPKGLSPP